MLSNRVLVKILLFSVAQKRCGKKTIFVDGWLNGEYHRYCT